MSVNQLFYEGPAAPIQEWKNIAVNNLYANSVDTTDLIVNGSPLAFQKFDLTVPVSTYSALNTLITPNVFNVDIHAVVVGSTVICSISGFTYTVVTECNYFAFQLPSQLAPNAFNAGVILILISTVASASKYALTPTGQVRISKDFNNDDFTTGNGFAMSQNSIVYDLLN